MTTETTMTRDEALAVLAGALPANDEWGIETVAVPVAAIRAVVEAPSSAIEVDADLGPEPCPMGCGRTTEDVAGGPCSACWDLAE